MEEYEPEGDGDGEPEQQQRRGDDGGGRFVTMQQKHGAPGVYEKGGSAEQHAARFDGGVVRAVGSDGERESGESDGRGGAEKAGETSRLEDGTEDGEGGNEEAAYQEPEEELKEHVGLGDF